mmetsp:Transcript_5399/g.11899  ORF Transcript_5399/g.11899 Transcript_5399/m.11899 type:complete len:182 (-) Transcript_5399:983-1528(-)|eukprot:CAMPEP_0202903822 /NCGR_PEP_ID=MMETSP1392-20130828/26565_1 /ASSEMBLY_ACC=CAM_ASM_000868 /TAXON_ID=225041 /ORGANISM="Chlamydomonas chlamydogama, Strain SAG 11-48b" /LENGTH=181 /DNA_ID=CAMNT_0049591165 /DNA_START=347 /DNA_END=892 /DNA_ORIENTATION=-
MYLERTSTFSVARLPSVTRSPAKGQHHHFVTPVVSTSTIVYALGVIACVLLFVSTYQDRQTQAQATALGKRSTRDLEMTRARSIEAQLIKKEEEIESLKQQLERIYANKRISEANMQAQEAIIRKLQERHEAERAARSKAQYALSERSQALQLCQKQQLVLEQEIISCGRDLSMLKKAGEM